MPTITLPQGPINYREAGTGEPIVFLHGYMMDSRLWDPVVEILRKDFRTIALDLPLGAHRTPLNPDADLSHPGLARLVADALAGLDLDGVTLVGNDTGGAIAQLVAVGHPERLARLVLTPCDAFDNFPPKLFRPLRAIAHIPGGLTAAFEGLKLKRMRYLPNSYGWLSKRELDDDMVRSWVDAFFADRGVRRDCVKATKHLGGDVMLDAAARLVEFDKPALVAWATEDRLFPLEHGERLAKILPLARFSPIEDSRTYVMVDQPERTAEAIAEFVRETTVQTPAAAPAGSQSAG